MALLPHNFEIKKAIFSKYKNLIEEKKNTPKGVSIQSQQMLS